MNWWSSKSLLWEGLAYQLEVEFRIESKALALCFTFLPSRCTVIWFIWWWFWMCCLPPRFQWTEWWWRSLAIPDARSGQGSALGWKFVEEKLPETDQTDPLPFKIREMFHNFLYFQNWSRVKKSTKFRRPARLKFFCQIRSSWSVGNRRRGSLDVFKLNSSNDYYCRICVLMCFTLRCPLWTYFQAWNRGADAHLRLCSCILLLR